MDNVTVIIPVHEIKNETKQLLSNCLKSVSLQEKTINNVLIVKSNNFTEESELLLNDVNKEYKYKTISNTSGNTYQEQINFAVDNIDTEYFTILEFDDELSSKWSLANEKHLSYDEFKDTDILLNLVAQTDVNGNLANLTNEIFWAYGYSEERGKLDLEGVKNYPVISLNGALIKTESFKKIGKLKTKIVVNNEYEFLLRAVNEGLDINVLPRIVYKHLNGRKESIQMGLTKKYNGKELKALHKVPLDEYHFTEDREIELNLLDE